MSNQAFVVYNGKITVKTEIYDGGLYFADTVKEVTQRLRDCETLVVKSGSERDLKKIVTVADLFTNNPQG